MKSPLLIFSLFWMGLLASTSPAQQLKAPATLAELQNRLTEQVSQPRFAAALWGVKVVALESGKTLFDHNAQKLFSPASNSKLYTVALALDRLGEGYRIKTSLYAKALPDKKGVVEGDLIVYGRGDPTINARLHNGDIYQALEPLVQALTNAGVKQITGDLVGDQSFIHGPEFGSGWDWADLESYYGAEISALTINDNALQVSVRPGDVLGAPCNLALIPATACLTFSNRTVTAAGGARRTISFYRPVAQNVVYASGQIAAGEPPSSDDVTFHNPGEVFISFLKEALSRHGIKVGGKLRTANWLDRQAYPLETAKLAELGAMESLPMRDIAREVMKPSQNLYTDLLLAQVGERRRTAETPARRTSEELGILELQTFLSDAGVKRGDVLFEEGSGLSRNNLTTPNATIALLQYMNHHKSAEAYLQALPIAGVDGTLKSRMKGTPAAGNVRAKTGTLRWANSLSGYVTTAAGERLVFSIMLNRYQNSDPNRSARTELDAIAVMLAGFTGKTSE
jgi:D-alanyl-D-alanine carboxypeptidase/D-alanyl-D-alanine-endopeptidase (penicillin-binding protein 4)